MQSLARSSFRSNRGLFPRPPLFSWNVLSVLLGWFAAFCALPCLGVPSSIDEPPTFSVTLAWDPSSSPEAVGYQLYFGVSSGQYTSSVKVGNVTRYTLSGLNVDTAYFFAVRAYASNGLESDFSNEITSSADLPKLSPRISESGEVYLSLMGLAGQRYQILATQSFQDWQPVGTVVADENGAADFIDPQVRKYPRRFYYPVEMGP